MFDPFARPSKVLDHAATFGGTESEQSRIALWQQRLFETESGLTDVVLSRGVPAQEWFQLQRQLFQELPGADGCVQDWQGFFFRAQALMERFLVTRFGHEVLIEWAQANGTAHGRLERQDTSGARGPAHRIARQAALYGSVVHVPVSGADQVQVDIAHCGIWDYREQARSRGVPITLTSPCEYCTHAISANVLARGCRATYRLHEGPEGRGCTWSVTPVRDARQVSAPRLRPETNDVREKDR